MRTPVEATGRRWNLAVFACFLGVVVAITGMLGTGSLFLWIGVVVSNALQRTSTARTIRVHAGKVTATDGPRMQQGPALDRVRGSRRPSSSAKPAEACT